MPHYLERQTMVTHDVITKPNIHCRLTKNGIREREVLTAMVGETNSMGTCEQEEWVQQVKVRQMCENLKCRCSVVRSFKANTEVG